MKKYINLLILGILLVSFGSYYFLRNVSWDDVLLKLGQYDQKITIMNTADVHGHIMFEDNAWGQYTSENIYGVMGLPLVKYLFELEKKDNPNTILVDTGDMFHGTNEANVDKGEGILKIANLMGYTAMIPGSNDFNFGYKRFMELSSSLNTSMVSANLYRDGERLFEPYRIVEIGGKKIALMGLLTTNALRSMSADEIKGVTVEDPVQEATKVVAELKDKVDVIVLLSHLGDDADVELAKKVDGIDLILSGRRHNLYTDAVKVGNTYIVEAGAWTTHVGYANLYFKGGKLADINWKVRSSKNESKSDAQMTQIAEQYHAVALEQTKEVVGKSEVELNGMRTELRTKETNFANLLTDAMKEKAGADIALLNGGGIRESIKQGDINLYELNKSLPFANSMMVVNLKGDNIYRAIERGLRAYPNGTNGAFLQVSGIEYTFDASKSADKRLVEVLYQGKPLDKNQIFKVAISDYLYNGGDNYDEFKDAEVLQTDSLLMTVLADHIKKYKVVSPKEDGRIIVTKKRYKS